MKAVWIIARLTFREAARRRIALAALVLGGLFLLLYSVGFYFIQQDLLRPGSSMPSTVVRSVYNFLLMAGMYAVNFLTLAMGALLAADTLAGEIGSGAIQTLVSKPIARPAVVLGKWLGFAAMQAMYLALMAGGVIISLRLQAAYLAPNLPQALGLMYLGSVLVMTVTLLGSSRLSGLATGGTVFGLYGLAMIGGWVEQAGTVLNNQTAINVGIFSSLLIPSEALWKRAAFEMSSPMLRTFNNPFTAASPPSDLMIAYAALYLLAALALTAHWFSRRDL